MKTRLLFLSSLFLVLIANAQESTPYSDPAHWQEVFTDNFDGDIVSNWVIQDNTTRWLQEQVFLSSEAEIVNEKLRLNISYCPTGCGYNNGNGKPTKYKSGEVYSKERFLYGYIEARIKFPSGAGAFPAFWLFPLYREGALNLTDYPEELDIVESRSVKVSAPPYVNHLYTQVLFYNDDETVNDTNSFLDNTAAPYAGSFHTYAVKWTMF